MSSSTYTGDFTAGRLSSPSTYHSDFRDLLSMVSKNVRLSDQHKCHPYFARWYEITPNRPVTSSWAD